jgi:hypothetical protein
MSAEQKTHGTKSGQPETPMQLMKDAWKRMSDDARDYWREQFSSSRKLSELRAELHTKLKIKFNFDARLSEFRSWVMDQDMRDEQAERLQENEARLIAQHPDWSLERIREEVLRQSYFQTLASGDFKLGLKTVKAHQNQEVIGMDERRLKLLEKKAAAYDEAKGILGDRELTEQQRETRMRELFGTV